MAEMENAVAVAALLAIGLFTVVTWVFVVRYAKIGTWRTYREGRTLMFMKICLALIGTTIFVFRFWFSGPEYFSFRAAVYILLFVVMTWQMVNFNRYLLKSEDDRNERSDTDTAKTEGDSVL